MTSHRQRYLCLMKDVVETIGVRELRQHASRYLAMVKEGRRIAITQRGELVGYLEPVERPTSAFGRLVAAGAVQRATERGTRGLPPPLPLDDDGPTMSQVVQEMRDEERW
jgi:prevent-host-death family protein